MVKVNPILNKEVKLLSRTVRLPIILMLYNAVLACVAIIALASFVYDYQNAYSTDFSNFISIFSILGGIQCGLICLMVPILTGSAIAGERERQTLDLMLTTDVRPFSIVLGKLFAQLLTVFILVFSSIPVLSVAFIFGGMNWLNILYMILVLMAIAFLVGSVGIFCSSFVKKTTVAIVFTFLIGILVVAGTYLGVFLTYMVKYRTAAQAQLGNAAVDMGAASLILLLNPLVTFYDFIQRAAGGRGAVSLISELLGVGQKTWVYSFAEQYWLLASIALQLLIALLFLKGAAHFINPLRGMSHHSHKRMRESAAYANPPMENRIGSPACERPEYHESAEIDSQKKLLEEDHAGIRDKGGKGES